VCSTCSFVSTATRARARCAAGSAAYTAFARSDWYANEFPSTLKRSLPRHGKLTFPALLGIEASRRRAEELVAGAIDSVSIFGPKADPLAALAKYVIERNH
jgi:hypothetical protein